MSRQRDYIWVASTPRDRRRKVIVEIAEKHGVDPAAMTGPLRKRHTAYARFEAMARIRDEFGDGYHAIARTFGLRDHSSVANGIRRFREMEAR